MLQRSQKLTALFFTFFISLFSLAQEKTAPRQLLENMRKANEQLDYEIAFVQTTPVNMESLRYRHVNQNGKIYAQLITLDNAPQEIVQRGNIISYFQPNYQVFSLQGSQIVDNLPSIMWSNFDLLSNYYDFINIGRNRVADRIVQTIRILPKDDFRYQYLVFIDEQSNLLLRSDMLDREGNLLDQFRVVNLHINEGLDDLPHYLNNITFPPLISRVEPSEVTNIPFSWNPEWLPKGFKLINKMLNQDKENQIESLLYSDGLFSFTLYCGHSIIPNIPENAWKQGSTTFYSETKENKEFTFIGQLPLSTAKRIVQDIRYLSK
ncbi:sigma-E factor regulatory protein RseB [Seminibacterium arietis]|uniref:Sigma-E factor regulatory protein RseB n=1 Tax=Seminibacterium arietis TaxID=1173502 RepID=A0ABW3IA83_9PAST